VVRKLFILAACLTALLTPALVRAQAGVHFSTVQVDIWPEYDRPSVLIIDHLTLAGGTALPASLTLRIPSQAEIWAVAAVDSTGALVNTSYSRQLQGDWTVLMIASDSLQVQVEYYETLDKTSNDRHISYKWAGDGAVDSFTIDFLPPPGASNLLLVPPTFTSSTNGNLADYRSAAISLKNGQTFTQTADYQKSTDALTVSGMPVQAAQPVTENTLGRLMQSGVIVTFVKALVGLLALGLLVWLIVRLVKDRHAAAHPVQAATAAESTREAETAVYCSQCGKRAQTGDVFCRSCGMRLRKVG
jgi:uncharacterized OB-fold protein